MARGVEDRRFEEVQRIVSDLVRDPRDDPGIEGGVVVIEPSEVRRVARASATCEASPGREQRQQADRDANRASVCIARLPAYLPTCPPAHPPHPPPINSASRRSRTPDVAPSCTSGRRNRGVGFETLEEPRSSTARCIVQMKNHVSRPGLGEDSRTTRVTETTTAARRCGGNPPECDRCSRSPAAASAPSSSACRRRGAGKVKAFVPIGELGHRAARECGEQPIGRRGGSASRNCVSGIDDSSAIATAARSG